MEGGVHPEWRRLQACYRACQPGSSTAEEDIIIYYASRACILTTSILVCQILVL
jgi:hypothetical protein